MTGRRIPQRLRLSNTRCGGVPSSNKTRTRGASGGATIVSIPKGRGKLWRNWDTQVGVILEGTRYVTIFHAPEEWAQILPVYQDPQRGIDEMR